MNSLCGYHTLQPLWSAGLHRTFISIEGEAVSALECAPDQVADDLQVLVPVDGRLDDHYGRHALLSPVRNVSAWRVALVRPRN